MRTPDNPPSFDLMSNWVSWGERMTVRSIILEAVSRCNRLS